MIGGLDFSLTMPMRNALGMAAAMPIVLAAVARLPWWSGRNALQFLVGSLVTLAIWSGLLVVQRGAAPLDVMDIGVSLMMLGAASLIYLEVWSLLSRGYTLGLLLTLYRAGGALDHEELARRYRGGEGLSWIMRHRLTAMLHTGLIRQQGDVIVLTPMLGVPVAWLYKVSVEILGLGSGRQ